MSSFQACISMLHNRNAEIYRNETKELYSFYSKIISWKRNSHAGDAEIRKI